MIAVATITLVRNLVNYLASLALLKPSQFKLVKFSLAFRLNFGIVSIPDFILLLVLIYKRRNEILDLKEKWFITKLHRTLIIDETGKISNGFVNLFDVKFAENLK